MVKAHYIFQRKNTLLDIGNTVTERDTASWCKKMVLYYKKVSTKMISLTMKQLKLTWIILWQGLQKMAYNHNC